MSYPDAHRYRIGINYAALPINKPHCTVATYHRDGQGRFDDNGGSSVNYEPNSFGGSVQDIGRKEPPLRLNGDADRYAPGALPGGSDDFSQAGALFRLMSVDQKDQLVANLVTPLKTVPRAIQLRQLGHLFRADQDYGARVAAGLGISMDEVRNQLDGR
jgi:catalase